MALGRLHRFRELIWSRRARKADQAAGERESLSPGISINEDSFHCSIGGIFCRLHLLTWEQALNIGTPYVF
jgi:hypothetical protein